jgi:hypothetical protein
MAGKKGNGRAEHKRGGPTKGRGRQTTRGRGGETSRELDFQIHWGWLYADKERVEKTPDTSTPGTVGDHGNDHLGRDRGILNRATR